jgi:hypothetical protein
LEDLAVSDREKEKRTILSEAAGELGLWDVLSDVEHDLPDLSDTVEEARQIALELYDEGWFLPICREGRDDSTKRVLSTAEFKAAVENPNSFVAPPFGQPAIWLEATRKWWDWKQSAT